MSILKDKLAQQIPGLRETVKKLVTEHGDKVISHVTVEQAFGGMRGVRALVCDTSEVPPEKGVLIRGIPIAELTGKLPEEVFWLMLTGELPNAAELADLQADLRKRAEVPEYVWGVLRAIPDDVQPMVMLKMGIMVMERESVFRKQFEAGLLKRDDYWVATLEDALNIIAKLPTMAAGFYRMRFWKGTRIAPDPSLDWAADYARMFGIPDPDGVFAKLMRLFMVLHSDHESGNVSAFTTFTVNSSLSDLYYSISAGLNGLAGPLHGLASQECLAWILGLIEHFGGAPTHEQIRKYAEQTLTSGMVIPGYGHAVLRITDPRFEALLAFGKKYCVGDPVFDTVVRLYETVPDVLKKIQKIKDPWPNVDAASGSLVYHFGLKEISYYTVLFGVSRVLGFCAQAVINRALVLPITRPKSVTTKWIQAEVAKN